MSYNPFSVESTGIADTVFEIDPNADFAVRITAAHESPDFAREVDEFEDAKRNEDPATWIEDFWRAEPEYTIPFDTDPAPAPAQPTDAEIDAVIADCDRAIAEEKKWDAIVAGWKAADSARVAAATPAVPAEPVVTVREKPEYRDVDDNATDALGQIDPLAAIAFEAFQVGRLTRPLRTDGEGRVFSPLKFTCGGEAEAFGMLIAEFNAAQQADAPAGRIEPGTDTLTAA